MRVTSFPTTITVFLLCLFVQLAQTASSQIASPSFAPAEQIVVLQNGEVLTGKVTQSETKTIVQTEQGSRLILSEEQVEFVCDTMLDAYWGKCARTKASDLAGQKSIFYWCLKHDLHEQAQNQILLLAESKKAKASDIVFLDRQLNVAIMQLEKRNQAKAQLAQKADRTPKTMPDSGEVNEASTQPLQIEVNPSIGNGLLVGNEIDFNTFRPLPSLTAPPTATAQIKPVPVKAPTAAAQQNIGRQQTIRQVGFEEEIESPFKTISLDHRLPNPDPATKLKDAQSPKPTQRPELATNAELDRMTRSMPEGSLAPYRSIERVLITGCNASNCHDSNAQVMPLLKLGRSKPIPRRMSQRNLHQTLKHIDRSNPFASPLLAAASQPHAGVEKPILPVGSKHYEQLQLWLIMLSDDPESNYQGYLNPGLQKTNQPAKPMEEIGQQPADAPAIVPVEPERIGLQPVFEHSQTIGEIPELNKQAESYQASDPFDPEIFNRQFGDQ